ncbi:MAG: S-layer homology domain-containing protein [Patescibacteria group bacterium]
MPRSGRARALPAATPPGKVNTQEVPDILTKAGKMSDQLMLRFNQVFSKLPGMINDLVTYTGRYVTSTPEHYGLEVDSPINLITAKDQYTLEYLKAVNTMVENKIDSLVKTLQQDTLLGELKVQVKAVRLRENPNAPPVLMNTPGTLSPPAVFVNYTPAFAADGTNFLRRLNGYNLDAVTSVAQCTPYRGSKGVGQYSKLVEINRALDEQTTEFDADANVKTGRTPNEKDQNFACYEGLYDGKCQGYEHFAGCFNDSTRLFVDPVNGALTCFPERATDPIFDLAGTQEVDGLPPANFDNFNVCLNFHEKNQFIEYLKSADARLEAMDDDLAAGDQSPERSRAVILSRAQSHGLAAKDKDPSSIVLFSQAGADAFEVTLADVLRAEGWDSVANPEGWHDVLAKLLVSIDSINPRTIAIDHPKVASVDIVILRDFEKSFSSVFMHKEPTNETLQAQLQGFITKDLPVDSPRYVTFQNALQQAERITYPDIFSENSFEDFKQKLRDTEVQLNAIATKGQLFNLCDQCLVSLLSPLPEVVVDGEQTLITRANLSKVGDALTWKDMDIDTKHQYLAQHYLGSDLSLDPFVGRAPNGYELAYFNGEGTSDRYEFTLNANQPEEDDAVYQRGVELQETPEPEILPQDDPKNPFDTPPPSAAGQAGYDLFSWNPPPISPWWERMKEWVADLKETTQQFTFGKSEKEFYDKLDAENKAQVDAVKKESSDAQGVYTSGGDLPPSRLAKVELEADSQVVSAGKRVDVRVMLKDKDGKPVDDEFVKVMLSIEGEARWPGDEGTGMSGKDNKTSEITMFSGTQEVSVLAPDVTANFKLTAQVADSDITTTLDFSALAGAKLALQSETVGVVADGKNTIAIDVFAWDANNDVISEADGKVRLAFSDASMGRLASNEIELKDGRGQAQFIAGKRKGKVSLNAVSGNFDPGQLELSLLPGAPASIALAADAQTLAAVPDSQVIIQASIFDANGNMVDTNSAVQIDFRISEKTSRFGNLSSASETVTNGVAFTGLSPRDQTGAVNIIAESPGLTPGAITIKSVKQYGAREVADIQANALAVALLGIPAGNVTESGYLGGLFTMRGKTQTANSLTTSPKQYQKLLEVTERGGVRMPDQDRVSVHFLPANYFTMILKDTHLQTDLAQLSLVPIKDGQFEVTQESDPEKLADGIYLRKISESEVYSVDLKKGALRVAKDDRDGMEVQTNGFARIFDNEFSVQPKFDAPGGFLILSVMDGSTPVAEVIFVQHFNQDVRMGGVNPDGPGVYVQPFALPPQISHSMTFTASSSEAPRGVAFYDKSEVVTGSSAPGFAFQSLEDSADRFGVGFTQDNKFALLFASGETFGEANRPYASDAGIVLGDPTVRVANNTATGFSPDVGKMISAGVTDVRAIIGLDYNTDGFEDILIAGEDGKVRLIQNNGGYDHLKDQGVILYAKNGIQDITKADVNNDGQMDLVLAAQESCKKGETCIDIYENQAGAFVRKNLQFEQSEKIITVRAQDVNLDEFDDLVLADTAGNIKIIYNQNGTFDVRPQLVGNIGLQVDPGKNLIGSVLIRYAGMATSNPGDPTSGQNFARLSLKEANPEGDRELDDFFGRSATERDPSVNIVEREFIYADADEAAFKNSTKFAEDLNGGVVETGDIIRYTITLKNDSGAVKNNVMVSDSVSEQTQLDANSIKCEDCGATSEMAVGTLDGDPVRAYLFENIDVPARGQRNITYDTTFLGSSTKAEKIIMQFSSKFTDGDGSVQTALRADNYVDISVTKEGNPTGRVRYFFSKGIAQGGRLIWDSALSTPGAAADSAADTSSATGVPPVKDQASAAAAAQTTYGDYKNKDSDGDGLPDSIDDLNGTLDGIAEGTQALVNKLTCNAGCIALPLNMSFLTPGLFQVLGIPVGPDIGLPAFGWGSPVPPFVSVFAGGAPFLTTTGGRFYVSPTLTGGVGFALCLGAYGLPKNCFSFGLNVLDLMPGNICDKLSGVTAGAMAAANAGISKLNEGMTVSIGGGGTTGANSRRSEGSGFANYSLGSYESPVATSRNIRIPGFPSVITEWAWRQLEEITDKALSLPDIYVIYPSWDSMSGAVIPQGHFSDFQAGNAMSQVLSYINSMPLIDIETEEVLFKIPLITRKEKEKAIADFNQWIKDERLELDKWQNALGCLSNNFANLELCQFVTADMNRLIATVAANMKALDDWILFPKKILQFRAIESYYLSQIIDYLDTMIEFTGGWTKRNIARVKEWRQAVRNFKKAIESWKLLVKIMTDYNDSCDKCKTERFTLMDLVLKLFVAIPTPPVIPIPKLPDIVLDVSKVQAGVKVLWPDIQFKPEPLTLPRLPHIGLGVNLTIPQFKLLAPEIPVIPPPPDLPRLPALPPLNLPRLPDLPPPPTLPGFPPQLEALLKLLKKILKIICLIRLGFVPTDELLLKTRIEEITARGLSPILPVDMLFTIQSPTISVKYVDQIVVTAFTNLGLNLDYVQKQVEDFARTVNNFSTGFAGGINKFTQSLQKQTELITNPTINIGVPGVNGGQINYREDVTKELSQLFHKDAGLVVDDGIKLRDAMLGINQIQKQQTDLLSNLPQQIKLEASTVPYVMVSSSNHLLRQAQDDIHDPFISSLVGDLQSYRNKLKARVDDPQKFDDLTDLVANVRSPLPSFKSLKYVASTNDRLESGKPSEPIKVGPLDFEGMDFVSDDSPQQKSQLPRLLAQADPGARPPPDATGPVVQNLGIYLIDENGKGKRLINYTLEADQAAQLADIDLDNDGDSEKIYSYGKNVYAKRNETRKQQDPAPTFRAVDLEYWTVFELLPKGTSPSFPKALTQTARETSFGFDASEMQGAVGYEIVAKHSPFFFENPQNHETLRAHMLTEFLDPPAVVPAGAPPLKPLYAELKTVAGEALFSGSKREYIGPRSGKIHLNSGDLLHPLEYVRIVWNVGTPAEQELELSKDVLLPVPDSFASGLDIEMDEGALEIIKSEPSTQPVQAGMALLFGDKIAVRTGSVTVHYARGGDTVIRSHEQYSLNKTDQLDKPSLSLDLPEGSYFAQAFAFDATGNRSTGSERFLLAPQVCGDDTLPVANAGSSTFEVAVGKMLTIDASRSFDASGKVVSYWLDEDTSVDSDGDGAANNDRDRGGDTATFTVGPYNEVGQKKMRLTVLDEALNEGIQDITVNVITPRLVLDPHGQEGAVITGFVDPAEENVPITLARLRPGPNGNGWEVLKTPSADENGQYRTDSGGKYRVSDLDLRDRLVVRDSTGKIIAEVHVKTGRITPLDDRYETRVIPSNADPSGIVLPLRLGLFLKTDSSFGNPLTYVYFVPDVNTDTTIDSLETKYDSNSAQNLAGVHIKPLAASLQELINWRILPGNDEQAPGATVAEKDQKRVVTVDVNGNIILQDAAITLRLQQAANPDDPVVFEVVYEDASIAEIFIATNLGKTERVQIMETPKATVRPKPVPRPRSTNPFTDVPAGSPFASTIEGLYKRGIVAGYPSNVAGELLYKPQNRINRAEFAQITLKMLCIVPREEAKKLPSPFYDVLDPKVWFYPVLKEGNIRGFIRGYLGEKKVDAATGTERAPFKPSNLITRAEAATVVLAALQEEDIIDLSKVDFKPVEGGQWYDPYIKAAQDLTPYLKNPEDGERAFLITALEAARPNEQITREDFAIMAQRVLLIADCYHLGSEQGAGDAGSGSGTTTTPPPPPPAEEPLTPVVPVKNEEGIYVLRPLCGAVCPCRATIGKGADIQPGDIIFTAITGPGGLPIYTKSNEETY